MKLNLRFLIATIFVLAIYIPVVHAQANLTFEGGNGSPLTITLQQSVTYTINNSNCSAGGPVFIFDEAGNPFLGAFLPVTGTMTFFINGGTLHNPSLLRLRVLLLPIIFRQMTFSYLALKRARPTVI